MSWSSCPWCSASISSWNDYAAHVGVAHPNGDPEPGAAAGLVVTMKEEREQ